MPAIRPHARGGTPAQPWRTFRRWRRSRPFWGGLLTLLGGVFIFGTTQMSLGGLSFQMGPTGFLSWLIPTILVACGVLAWVTPAQRMFYAIIAAVTALYSLIGVNLGGFFIGMLLALVGAGLVFAWTPVPGAPASTGEQPTAEQSAVDDEPVETTVEELLAGEQGDAAAPDRPRFPRTTSETAPGADRAPGSEPRLYGVALLVLSLAAVGAAALPTAGPAFAQECPIAKPTPTASPKPPPAGTPDEKPTAGPAPTPTGSPPATPSPAEPERPVQDFLEGVADGIGDLLGIGDDEEKPEAGATPTPTPTPGVAKPSPTRPARPPVSPRAPKKTGTKPAVKSVDSIKGCTAEDLQQPGPVVRIAAQPGQPPVARPSRLTGSRVSMFGLSYDGVVDLPTANGTIATLQFSMDRSVTDDFELLTPSVNDEIVSLKSTALTVEGDVKFYASRFHGTLLGIPLTFTPESPPPLTLPVMVFGDPDIQLAYVDCEVLKAPGLVVTNV